MVYYDDLPTFVQTSLTTLNHLNRISLKAEGKTLWSNLETYRNNASPSHLLSTKCDETELKKATK